MSENLKILLIGAECAPLVKTGGLADVLGALPLALRKKKMDARVMLPLHRQIKQEYGNQLSHIGNFYLRLGWRSQYVGIETMEKNGVCYYFIDNEYYFGGPVYKGGEAEGEQYAFFSKAAIDAIGLLDFLPDIIHVHDWHTAMIPMLLKTQYQNAPVNRAKTLLTIHNIAYQGKFAFSFVQDLLQIDSKYYHPDCLEQFGVANFLKAGIVFSDKINTVSPTYARELMYPYFGEGMEGILQKRKSDFSGILNGIDADFFNPETDPFLAAHYSRETFAEKQKNKQALMQEAWLTIPKETPLIGIVSRLTEQKGLDLIQYAMKEILRLDMGFVILGSGEKRYETFFSEMAHQYGGRVSTRIGYDEAFAHRIYAGVDFFLMPSKFEPCGISQMIALRYGTPPIVRETGGLADTVFPYDAYRHTGNGFSFANYNGDEMLQVIRYAREIYADQDAYVQIAKRGMEADHGFAAAAGEYCNLYQLMTKG